MYLIDRGIQIHPIIMPVDLESGANTGDWINMKNWHHCAIVFLKDGGTANDDPDLVFAQATVAAGTDTKALLVSKYWLKQPANASSLTLADLSTWTKVTQTASATVSLDGTSAEDELVAVFEFDSDELDSDGGFTFLTVSIADPGTAGAMIGTVFAILTEPRYADPSPLTCIA
jgi:hypothetical protein